MLHGLCLGKEAGAQNIFPCKVAGILLYASRLLRAAACVILLSFELNSVIRIGMAASRLR